MHAAAGIAPGITEKKEVDTMNRNNNNSNPKPTHMSWKEFRKNASAEQRKQEIKGKRKNDSKNPIGRRDMPSASKNTMRPSKRANNQICFDPNAGK